MTEPITVLLIDDQATICEAVRRMLAPEPDITFHYCTDPTQALKMARDCQPTAILQDLMMPGMDGLLLVKFFRAVNAETQNIPLIVLSSKEEPVIKAQAFELGANDYLVKLPDRVELVARIRYHSKAYINQKKRLEAEAQLREENRRQAIYIEQVNKVTSAAAAVEQNRFQSDQLTPVIERLDELGKLARVFSSMVETVKSREQELVDANAQLAALLDAYGRFVPHEYLQFLRKKSITEVELGDHVSKNMAVMFSDIRSFTTRSEQMTPKETFDFVNDYLRWVSPEIRNHYGLVVKFIGDGVMAVFPEGADDAIASALAQLDRVHDFNQELMNRGAKPIQIGLGIHMGRIMVGMIGEANRMQGDALSDSINLTARLEGLTKFYGVSLLISEAAKLSLDHSAPYRLRFLDCAIVKGRNEAIRIYEVLDAAPAEECELKERSQADFELGWNHYASGNLAASWDCFNSVLAINPNDKTAKLYLERLEILTARGLPNHWTGVWAFAEK
ncbi:MAG: adenylate/guanylate cyclase domain-containing response regulator [Oscillatoriales cyanobacterium]|nr:MAG: adenylate/guanylate cyclase domain-containing response regulator [Oscillatoriales cyanobacterium]